MSLEDIINNRCQQMQQCHPQVSIVIVILEIKEDQRVGKDMMKNICKVWT
jgi:hypothetical protein